MLFYSTKYLYRSLQRKLTGFVLLIGFSAAAHAQQVPILKDTLPAAFNPLVVAASKKPARLMKLHFNPPAYKNYVVTQAEN